MEWTGPGIILGTRRHGESSVIVELFSPDHGRHMGLVRGGRGKRWRGVLQPGNRVTVTWRARLEDHLGQYSVEPDRLDAASFMEVPLRLAALNTLDDLVRLLPERDPHRNIYDRYARILDLILNEGFWVDDFLRWELLLLQDLGFGLDLTSCAATEMTENLIYVSPKSGRAVSGEAGEPYKDKLLRLPQFLIDDGASTPQWNDFEAAFDLVKFFYARHIFETRGIEAPQSRDRMIRHLTRRFSTDSD